MPCSKQVLFFKLIRTYCFAFVYFVFVLIALQVMFKRCCYLCPAVTSGYFFNSEFLHIIICLCIILFSYFCMNLNKEYAKVYTDSSKIHQPLKLEIKDQLQMVMVQYEALTIHILFCFLKIQKQELGFYIVQLINTAHQWECTHLLFFLVFFTECILCETNSLVTVDT